MGATLPKADALIICATGHSVPQVKDEDGEQGYNINNNNHSILALRKLFEEQDNEQGNNLDNLE